MIFNNHLGQHYQYTQIIHAQRIMFVRDKEDMTKELRKKSSLKADLRKNGKFNSPGTSKLVS